MRIQPAPGVVPFAPPDVRVTRETLPRQAVVNRPVTFGIEGHVVTAGDYPGVAIGYDSGPSPSIRVTYNAEVFDLTPTTGFILYIDGTGIPECTTIVMPETGKVVTVAFPVAGNHAIMALAGYYDLAADVFYYTHRIDVTTSVRTLTWWETLGEWWAALPTWQKAALVFGVVGVVVGGGYALTRPKR